MGFLGTLYLGLFIWCLQKIRDKKKIRERIIALSIIGLSNVILAFIFFSTAMTTEDKEGAWVIIPMYFIFFGWRMVTDIISYNRMNSNTIKKESRVSNNTHTTRNNTTEAINSSTRINFSSQILSQKTEGRIKCPNCDEDLEFMGYENGDSGKCPFCNHNFEICFGKQSRKNRANDIEDQKPKDRKLIHEGDAHVDCRDDAFIKGEESQHKDFVKKAIEKKTLCMRFDEYCKSLTLPHLIEHITKDELGIFLLEVCDSIPYSPQFQALVSVKTVSTETINGLPTLVYCCNYQNNSFRQNVYILLVHTNDDNIRFFTIETDFSKFVLCEFSGNSHLNYGRVKLKDFSFIIEEILNS